MFWNSCRVKWKTPSLWKDWLIYLTNKKSKLSINWNSRYLWGYHPFPEKSSLGQIFPTKSKFPHLDFHRNSHLSCSVILRQTEILNSSFKYILESPYSKFWKWEKIKFSWGNFIQETGENWIFLGELHSGNGRKWLITFLWPK